MKQSEKYYGYAELCKTYLADFTSYQGLGQSPLYKREPSVSAVLKNAIAEEYRDFIARPDYTEGNNFITWHIKPWTTPPRKLSSLTGDEKEKYTQIKEQTLAHYHEALNKAKGDELRILAGILHHVEDQFIYCYDDRVVLIAWGMKPNLNKYEEKGEWVKDLKIEQRVTISFSSGDFGSFKNQKGDKPIRRLKGYMLKKEDYPAIVPNEGYQLIGWLPDVRGQEITEDLQLVAQYEELPPAPVIPETPEAPEEEEQEEQYVSVSFSGGSHGVLQGETIICLERGDTLRPSQIPTARPDQGYTFTGWDKDLSSPIYDDISVTATYDTSEVEYTFSAGEHGAFASGGNEFSLYKPKGESFIKEELPIITPKKGYKFAGWSTSPTGPLDGTTHFTALYDVALPWYKRKWWKRLLWLLAILLLILLLIWLLGKGCTSCSSHNDATEEVIPIEQVESPDGTTRDNNGIIDHILSDDGSLPDQVSVAPIIGDDGTPPPVVSDPDGAQVISDRLLIYLTGSHNDLQAWVDDFKKVYPSDDYKVIGADTNVQMVQIQIPPAERDAIRESLNSQLPNHQFFVVDEAIMTAFTTQTTTQYPNPEQVRGWHLKAIKAPEAWGITNGSGDITVAIVDDGIDASHPIFANNIVSPYNVFTQNSQLSKGDGHGTCMAAIIGGSHNYLQQEGTAGIAPNCKLMPIQVFDNSFASTATLTSGIMYAIHHGADVVNVSMGLAGLEEAHSLSPQEQVEASKVLFKNHEKLIRHITQAAIDKNVILVFSAGNDDLIAVINPTCRLENITLNVASTTPENRPADFTNYSLGSNISAPGVAVYSATLGGQFQAYDGTSVSAPIVSGAAALMKSLHKSLTPQQAITILTHTGKHFHDAMPPLIQIDKALQLTQEVANGTADLSQLEGPSQASTPPPAPASPNSDEKLSQLKQRRKDLSQEKEALLIKQKEMDKELKQIDKEIKELEM